MSIFSPRAIVFASVFVVAGAAVAALALRGEPPRRLKYDVGFADHTHVKPAELAQWIVEGRRDFAVVDLRTTAEFEKGHVRGAVHCGSCHETRLEGRKHQQGDQFVDLSKKLVLYDATGSGTLQLPRAIAKNPRLILLDGGYRAWEQEVLAPVVWGVESDPDVVEAKKRREALRAYFAGERVDTAAPARLPVTPIRREGAHRPAGPAEGC